MIQPRVYLSDVSPTNISPFGVTGNQLEIRGTQEVKFQLNRREFCHQFCVCLLPTEADGILGMDFFSEKNAELDLGKLQLRWQKGASVKHGYENQRKRQARSEAGCVALTVFTMQKEQFSRVERIPKDTRNNGTQVQGGTQKPLEFDLKEVEPWMVITTVTVKIASRVKQIVVGRLETPKRRLSHS